MSRRLEANERLEDQQEQQFAYDSMSTIFEVESEDSNSSVEDRQRESAELIGVEKSWLGEQESSRNLSNQDVNKDAQRVSPVHRDRFSGTLSALSEQVERLRRRSAELATQTQIEIPTATSAISPQTTQANEEPNVKKDEEKNDQLVDADHQHQHQHQHQQYATERTQMGSAESLMMINVSPSSSPKPARVSGFMKKVMRPKKDEDEDKDELKVVEVSNKSTITAIDLELMDQLVSRFFVDTRDQGTQSIEFDCPPQTPKVSKRSVAVGTEKFSRERFSPLPPTQTKGTQTKSSSNSIDLGASETRRFKLSHLHFQPVRARQQNHHQQQQQESSVGVENVPTSDADDISTAMNSSSLLERQPPAIIGSKSLQTANDTSDHEPNNQQQTNSSARSSSLELGSSEKDSLNLSSKPTTVAGKVIESKLLSGESGEKAATDSLASSPQPDKMDEYRREETNKKKKPWTANSRSSSSLSDASDSLIAQATSKLDSPLTKNEDKEKKQIAVERKTPEDKNENTKVKEEIHTTDNQRQQTIPSVKTEVRVVIEIKDSKGRQISELRSDSELAPNRVRRLSELTRSRQVAVSPSQVLERLRNVGREHSLLYGSLGGSANKDYQATQLFASSSSPNLLSSAGNVKKSKSSAATANAAADEEQKWRQVSSSSIKNEIETEIRDSKRNSVGGGSSSGRQKRSNSELTNKLSDSTLLLLSTQANVTNQRETGERLELSQHATRYAQSGSRTIERRLVEGGASFDEGVAQTNPSVSKEEDHEHLQVAASSWSSPRIEHIQHSNNKSSSPHKFHEKKSSEIHKDASLGQEEDEKKDKVRSAKVQRSLATSKVEANKSESRSRSRIEKVPIRSTRFELEEERDERKQVSENGRLIYDDRLRERRFERSTASNVRPKSASPALSRNREQQQPFVSSTGQARSPTSNHHHHHLHELDVGQNSQLSSSSPETMDSGFAQTEQGLASSGSALNLIRPSVSSVQKPRPLSVGPVGSSAQRRSPKQQLEAHKLNNLDDSTESLNFVDDDADELIEQLGGETQVSYRTPIEFSTTRNRATSSAHTSPLPPPAFRSPSPPKAPSVRISSNRIASDLPVVSERRIMNSSSSELLPPKNETIDGTSTELCTRLTRRKRINHLGTDTNKNEQEGPAAHTRLEQTVFVPVRAAHSGLQQGQPVGTTSSGSRRQQSGIRAQVAFESDTDSMAERGNSANSGQSARSSQLLSSSRQRSRASGKTEKEPKKELLSETRFSRASHAPKPSSSSRSGKVGESEQRRITSGEEGDWDYSLRVNRIRGDRVDSRVR